MVLPKTTLLRSLQMILFTILFAFAPLAPAFLQEAHLQKSAELEHGHPVDAHVVDKHLPYRLKMLSPPTLPALFIVVSLVVVAGLCGMLRFQYPFIFLLRKMILLRPMKFTSTYVDVLPRVGRTAALV
ncbi:MAG TPA: hypothetical protein VEZ72_24505 [Paenibacillus sp.]|nr:hypothetical protein [Paenibacillus sp.]